MPDLTLSRLFCCGSAEKDLTPLPPNSANDVRHAKRRGRRRKTKERKTLALPHFSLFVTSCFPTPLLTSPSTSQGRGREGKKDFSTPLPLGQLHFCFPLPLSLPRTDSGPLQSGKTAISPPLSPPVDPPPFFSLLPTRRRRMETDYLSPSSLPLEVHERFPSAFSISFFLWKDKKGVGRTGVERRNPASSSAALEAIYPVMFCDVRTVHTV